MAPVQKSPKWFPITVVGALCLLATPPILVFANKTFSLPTAVVSPLSQENFPVVTTTATTTNSTVYSASQYISLSQQYFQDAYTLSQNRAQSEEDKKEILGKLQKAIDIISEGINRYPNRSELWMQRASIYTAIIKVAPIAQEAATVDLKQAQALSQHSPNQPNPPNHPNPPNGLELVKDQQALSGNVIVASPGETTSPYATNTDSSAFSATAILPAGQTSMTIQNTRVSDTGPIYIVPKTNTTAILSLTNKIAGQEFTVTVDKAQDIDIPFQYWVTR